MLLVAGHCVACFAGRCTTPAAGSNHHLRYLHSCLVTICAAHIGARLDQATLALHNAIAHPSKLWKPRLGLSGTGMADLEEANKE